jgi:hypothetical protein
VPPRDVDRADDVLAGFDDDDADGFDLVDAGVGGVERAGDAIESDLSGDLRLEFLLECVQTEPRGYFAAPGRRTTYVGRPCALKRFITILTVGSSGFDASNLIFT